MVKEWLINLVGEIPKEWNWLVGEYDYNPDAKLVHFTIGTPCFTDYSRCDYAEEWAFTLDNLLIPMELWDGYRANIGRC